MIPLVRDTIDKNDIDKLIEWLKTYPHLTKGKLTVEYEKRWAEWLGTKYAVFVNSGSSANLLILYSLIAAGKIKLGDKVVVPTVSWSTDLAPVVQLGLEPILCDCNMEDLSIDINHFKNIIKEHNPKALMLVSVLGLVPQMDEILSVCSSNNVILLEDACESLGSKFKDQKIGTFGLMSSFSTYFGHHVSTIEGGMVCTDDPNIYNVLKSIRSHGWDRDLDQTYVNSLRNEHEVTDFEALYKFYYFGFNVRATDLQAFLGIGQLEKLDSIINERQQNYLRYTENIKGSYWKAPENTSDKYISNFAYPIIHPHRKEIVRRLTEENIAVRPLICGSLEKQPFWNNGGQVNLLNGDIVDKYGMYLPNNHQLRSDEIQKICDIINEVTG
jgi:CDP-4-dehydro-6-deoxyglucose reductase, E1